MVSKSVTQSATTVAGDISESKFVRLGEIADVRWGDTSTTKKSYSDRGFTAFSAKGPDGFLPYADFDRTGVVVSAIGADCGKTWLAKGKWSCIKNTIRFWSIDAKVDTEYLYWVTRNPLIWPKRGSAQPFISQTDARNMEVQVPPLLEQRRIAHILGTLDDKIELNRRMNETLEEMARAIFKDWFVDFGPVRAKMEGREAYLPEEIWRLFPDRLVASEMGEVPEGWGVDTLGNHITVLDHLRIPLNKQQRTDRNGTVPYYGATGIMDYVDHHLFDGIHVLTGEDGSVIDDKGFPIVQYVWGRFWVNNHAHVLRGIGTLNEDLLYLLLKTTNVASFVTGAVQPKLNQRNLKAIPVVRPDYQVWNLASDLVNPLFVELRSKFEEAQAMIKLRDVLLPRLVSGEVSTQDAEHGG